jgi:hydrogenase expression/formation protein HypC
MCLAIPSRIVLIDQEMAVIDVDGTQREASLLLLEDARVGDYVIVHAGFAIHKIDEASAMETLALLREAANFAALMDEKAPEGPTETGS